MMSLLLILATGFTIFMLFIMFIIGINSLMDTYDIPEKICKGILYIILLIPMTIVGLIRKLFKSNDSKTNEVTNEKVEYEANRAYIINVSHNNKGNCSIEDYSVNFTLQLEETNVSVNRIILYNHSNVSRVRIYFDNFDSFINLNYKVDIDYVYKKLNECSTFNDIDLIE